MDIETWLMQQKISEKNAKNTMKVVNKLAKTESYGEFFKLLVSIIVGVGKEADLELVEAVADCWVGGEKKWSAERLRRLYEGKGIYKMLVAIIGLKKGCAHPLVDDVVDVYKRMAIVGDKVRGNKWRGIKNDHLQREGMEYFSGI